MLKFKVSKCIVCFSLYLFTYVSSSLIFFLVPQPLLVLDPSDTIIILGTTVTLTCTVSIINSLSATVTTITWYKDGTIITNGITNTFDQGQSTVSLGTILSEEAGNYTCAAQISSPYIDDGSVIIISNSTNITVQSKLTLIIFIVHISSYLSNKDLTFHCKVIYG